MMATIPRTCSATMNTDGSRSPLARAAGPLALLAGVLIVVQQLVMFRIVDRGQLLATLANPLYEPSAVAYFVAFCGLSVALVAVYHWEARGIGTFGTIGFVAALVGTMFLAGDQWYEAFAAPWLVAVAPALLTTEPSGILLIGALTSYTLFSAGWVLFGLANLRARVLPRAISAAFIISGIVGFSALMPPYAVPLGLTMAWLGVWLLRTNNPAKTIAQHEKQDCFDKACAAPPAIPVVLSTDSPKEPAHGYRISCRSHRRAADHRRVQSSKVELAGLLRDC